MTTPRRAPQQARSRALVGSILEATAALLVERPAHELTTTMIAQRASCSVAAVYRFFANREAIFVQLGNRYRVQLASIYEGLVAPPPDQEPVAVAGGVFDRLIAFIRTEPGFRNLWWSGLIDASTIGLDHRDGKRYIAERLHAMFEPASKPCDRPGVRYVVCVEAADHLLGVAFRTRPAGDRQLLDETARLLAGYLTRANHAIT